MSDPIFEGWAILELMGHRRVAGYVREVSFAGTALARVDIPGDDGPSFSQFYGGSSIYCMTPCTEEAARGVARANRPEPVHSYELPRLPVARRATQDDPDLDEPDDVCPHGIDASDHCADCDEEEATEAGLTAEEEETT